MIFQKKYMLKMLKRNINSMKISEQNEENFNLRSKNDIIVRLKKQIQTRNILLTISSIIIIVLSFLLTKEILKNKKREAEFSKKSNPTLKSKQFTKDEIILNSNIVKTDKDNDDINFIIDSLPKNFK